METWPQDYVDLEVFGFFEFSEDGLGSFQFGAVRGWLDVRVSSRIPMLEFSWQGEDAGRDCSGRGLFDFPDPDHGEGRLFIHCGEESGVRIERIST